MRWILLTALVLFLIACATQGQAPPEQPAANQSIELQKPKPTLSEPVSGYLAGAWELQAQLHKSTRTVENAEATLAAKQARTVSMGEIMRTRGQIHALPDRFSAMQQHADALLAAPPDMQAETTGMTPSEATYALESVKESSLFLKSLEGRLNKLRVRAADVLRGLNEGLESYEMAEITTSEPAKANVTPIIIRPTEGLAPMLVSTQRELAGLVANQPAWGEYNRPRRSPSIERATPPPPQPAASAPAPVAAAPQPVNPQSSATPQVIPMPPAQHRLTRIYWGDYGHVIRLVMVTDEQAPYEVVESPDTGELTVRWANTAPSADLALHASIDNPVASKYMVTMQTPTIAEVSVQAKPGYALRWFEVEGEPFKLVLDMYSSATPTTEEERLSFAHFYATVGYTDQAIDQCRALHGMDPASTDYNYFWGMCLLKRDKALAAEKFRQVGTDSQYYKDAQAELRKLGS